MATVQAYTKSGVDAKFNSRSNMTMVHNGGGTPNLASYPDAKSGDVIERNSDGARWNVLAGTLNPDTGRVVSVAGKTGIVTLGPTDVGAAPTSHKHTKAQITDLNASTAATANSIAQRTTNGRLVVGTPTSSTDATTKAYVDQKVAIPQSWSVITDKPSAYPPAAHTHTKAQITDLNASTAATANTIAQRTTGGRLVVGTPTSSTDAATKAYVDSAATNASKWSSITGKPGTVSDTINTTNAGAYLVLNSGGRISAGTPTQDSDVANKAYVDSKTWTIDNIADLAVSTSATANTVAQRTTGGRLLVGAPTSGSDATTKTYVDTAVAGKTWANLSGKPSTFTPSTHTHTKAQISDLNASATATANSIAQRTSDGRLVVSTPTQDTDAATKAYVDSSVPASMAWSSLTGVPSSFKPSSHSHTKSQIVDLNASEAATSNSVAQRDSGGRLVVGTPTTTTHATTKAYVDSQITSAKAWGNLTGVPSTFTPATHTHTIAQITDLTVATTATANTVAQRTTGGRLVVGTPSANSEATTKAYVDSAVTASKAWANLTGKPSTFPPSTHTHTRSQISDLPNIVYGVSANAIVKTNADGRIMVHNVPTENQHAASKNYVDRTLDAKFESTALTEENLNNVLAPGNYTQRLSINATVANNYPESAEAGHLVVARNGTDFVLQEYTDFRTEAKHYRTMYRDTWYPWKPIADSTYVDRTLDAKFEPTVLTTEDLNNVEVPGNYSQRVDSNATTARNYPNNRKSGHLVVTGSDDFVLQEYTEYDSKAKYYRTKYGAAWYPWVRIAEEPWTGTQAQYNAITTKDPNRLYIIVS